MVCISPPVFLSWTRHRLEARGVQSHYSIVRSLAELRDFGHDVLINVTGARTKDLKDVDEPSLVPYRLQSLRKIMMSAIATAGIGNTISTCLEDLMVPPALEGSRHWA